MANENDRQLDRDILESKKDILKARQQNSSDKTDQNQAKKPEHPAQSQISRKNQNNSENVDIPEFSLANQMMAEHRKSVARKRKAPGSQAQPAPSKPSRIKITTHKLEHPPQRRPESRIISEIVARDIERIYQGRKTS